MEQELRIVSGNYTAGILDVFLEHGITFDGVIGVSAGAIHGVSYISKQKGRSLRYYKKYGNDPRFMGLRSWLKTGDYIGVDFCYHELPEKLDVYDNEAFMSSETKFYAVCTDVERGKPVYHHFADMYKEIDYLRASASLPYFSRLVE
ncbi:MAG: patatin family protein [Lachnospiraceae bacterium]|nr:patatin family protein [Lachnospiraceae bacterium]